MRTGVRRDLRDKGKSDGSIRWPADREYRQMAGQLSAVDSDEIEREYVAHRRSVLAVLRSDFGGVPDHEEIYQEAWTEVLELRARGEDIHNLGGLLRTIAWRRGRDRLRKHKPESLDPTSWAMVSAADPAVLPDEEVAVRVDAAVIRQVVDSLEPRHAAVITLRFDRHLTSREIQQELGVSAKRLEKIVTEAYARVARALTPEGHSDSEWRQHQRSLLMACEAGLASEVQRRKADAMVRADPACRAMLAEIRSALDQVAAILPLPLLVAEAGHSRLAQIRLGIADRFGTVRDQLADVAARLGGHGSSAEQAGAGGAASVGTGMAVKAALTCVALTGTTVVCLAGVGGRDPKPPRPAEAQAHHVAEPLPPRVTGVRTSTPTVTRHGSTQRHRTKVAEPAAAPPPSPAPASSTEFGPGAVGSTAASATPAAAPASSDEFTP